MTPNHSSTARRYLVKRLGAYSAAAAATATATNSAVAAHVMHDIADVTVGTGESVNFFMNNGTVSVTSATVNGMTTLGRIRLIGDTTGATYPGPWAYVPLAGSGFVGSGSYTAIRLGAGVSVNAADTFVNYAHPTGNFSASLDYNWAAVGDRGFLGIKFDLADGTHYGWADITKGAESATLHAFGYNTTVDAPAITGIPEPSAALLFAAGAAGLGMRRKRKST